MSLKMTTTNFFGTVVIFASNFPRQSSMNYDN